MNNRQIFRDRLFRIIGYIETKPNGDLVAKDRLFRIVGTYSKVTDRTKDFYGRFVSEGNTLTSLFDYWEKK